MTINNDKSPFIIKNTKEAKNISGNVEGNLSALLLDANGNTYSRPLNEIGNTSEVTATKTKAEIDAMIIAGLVDPANGLVPGTLYRITGVHPTLYNDGTNSGTTIILQALTPTILAKEGYGEFWNPKYNQSIEGFGIWTNLSTWTTTPLIGTFNSNEVVTANNGAVGQIFATIESNQFKVISGNWALATSITGNASGSTALIASVVETTYPLDTKVIWGGYSWTNISGNIGIPEDTLTLNGDWSKDVYTTDNYNKALDVISYDYENDWINRRYEVGANNEVVYSIMLASWQSQWAVTAINSFQFGNPINWQTYYGIGTNRVLDSYFECINFRGKYIFNNTLETGSQIKYNTWELGATLESNGLRGDCEIANNTCSSGYIYNNQLIGYGSRISSNAITVYGSINNNLVQYGSGIRNISIINSKVEFNSVGDSSNISFSALRESIISHNNLDSQSNIINVKLLSYSEIRNCRIEKQGVINLGLSFPLSGKIIQYLTVESGTITGDLSAATLVFSNYPKTAYKKPDGTTKIRYYNNSDVLVIAPITT